MNEMLLCFIFSSGGVLPSAAEIHNGLGKQLMLV